MESSKVSQYTSVWGIPWWPSRAALISYASEIMLEILQASLQQYVNRELPDVQAGFRKGTGTRDKLPASVGSLKKQENSRKTSILLTMPKLLTTVDHNRLLKILKEMGIPDHLTCLLRNLYADQEAIVRTGHGTTDWFQIGKGVLRLYIVTCLFNLRLPWWLIG